MFFFFLFYFFCVYYKFTIETREIMLRALPNIISIILEFGKRKVHPMGMTSLIKTLLPSNTKYPLECG